MDGCKLFDTKRETTVGLFGSRQVSKVTPDGLDVCDIIVREQDVANDLPGTLGFPDDDD